MEQEVAKHFSERLLYEAMLLFEADASNLKLLGDFENYVYEVTREGKPYVLRLTHSSHREYEQVEAELAWILFLKKKGIAVAAPILSIHSRFAECLPGEEGYFIASLFEKAPGDLVSVDDHLQFNERLFFLWGEAIGAMHEATRTYSADHQGPKRMEWEKEEMGAVLKVVQDEPFLAEKLEKLLKQIRKLPVNDDVYGLIHADVHSGNFFMDGQCITVFDFDDCCYHWFVNDLAIPLFYSAFYRYPKHEQARNEFAEVFLRSFLAGYFTRCKLEAWWVEQIPLFLKLRDITFYAVLRLKLRDKELATSAKERIVQVRERIQAEKPVVDLNYGRIFYEAASMNVGVTDL